MRQQIALYEPACLIVGTRGKSLGGIQGLLPGSVSKYCLQNSPVPVIVVRPSAKREKKKRKRRADPNRRSYLDILNQSSARGSQILDKVEAGQQPQEVEAVAVLEALGVSPAYVDSRRDSLASVADGSPLKKVESAKSDYSAKSDRTVESPSPTGRLSPDEGDNRGMQSLQVERLDSPDDSDAEEDDSEETSQERDLFGSHKPSRVVSPTSPTARALDTGSEG